MIVFGFDAVGFEGGGVYLLTKFEDVRFEIGDIVFLAVAVFSNELGISFCFHIIIRMEVASSQHEITTKTLSCKRKATILDWPSMI